MKKIYVLTILFALLSVSVWAQLPYNTTLTQSHYNDSKTVIKKEGTVNWNGGGIRLGTTTNLTPGNWEDKYVVVALSQTSVAYQLTFKYKCNSGIATNPDWYVEESADNVNWSRIWSTVTPTSSAVSVSTDTYTATPIDLSKSTKYIKLCYSGNYSGTFSDIKVSDQAYVNDPVVEDNVITSLDFGSNTISSGIAELTFDVEWCNVDAMTVTSDNALFTVSPASFGGKAAYGTQTVTVGYNRNQEVGAHSGIITITNGTVTKTVTVSGVTTKREQAIHWNADLEATHFTMNAGDVLTGAELATADNPEAEITYESDNLEVIAVSEDGKTLYAVENGTATITITATGNDIYNEKVESQVFTVTSKRKQVITWDQNLLGLKTTDANTTIVLDATATSEGVITYALEGEAACITLSGENNSVLTITGTPGEAYIIATQEGGIIGEDEWISATYRKHVKVRDPQSACDEYALADQSFTFAQGHKETFVVQEYNLVGKPTQLTFNAKAGGKQYVWSEREPIYIDQYANFGSGLEWQQVASITLSEDNTGYGPYALNETATKIRFRTGDYSQQAVSNISIPRKKEMVVSETDIVETAERNVRWSKTVSVSRSNIDVVDITLSENCPFVVSKTSIGTDCADRSTETFEISFTPNVKDSVYTGSITISDGKANPTEHTITLSVTCTGYNQSILGFDLPATCSSTDVVEIQPATASSGLEVVYLSSDSTIAYVEEGALVILSAGTVDIIAYQAGDDVWNEASERKTIVIALTEVDVFEAPEASDIAYGATLGQSVLTGGVASVEGTFAWANPEIVPEVGMQQYQAIFTPSNSAIYATATVDVDIMVVQDPVAQEIIWDGELEEVTAGEAVELFAYATSGLEVSYISSDSTVAYFDAELQQLITLAPDTITITAIQEGDGLYLAAELVAKTLIVLPAPTYGEYAAEMCEGDMVEFMGVEYYEATAEPLAILLEEKNIQGGDSIVMLTIIVHPNEVVNLDPETIREYATLVVEPNEWSALTENGEVPMDQAEYVMPEGPTEIVLVKHEQTEYGCDKKIVRHITVTSTVGFDQVETENTAVKELRDGVIYIRRGEMIYTITGLRAE